MTPEEILKAIEQKRKDRNELGKLPNEPIMVFDTDLSYGEWRRKSKLIEILDKQITDLKIDYIFEKLKVMKYE